MIKKLNEDDDYTNPNVYELKLTEMIKICNKINLKTKTEFFLLQESK